MLELLFRSRFRWRLHPRSVTGDATYGTKENIATIEKACIRAYTALADQQRRTSLFTIEAFAYGAQKDLYSCPAGETLRLRGHDHREGYVRYAAKVSSSGSWLSRADLRGDRGRWPLSDGPKPAVRSLMVSEDIAAEALGCERGVFPQADLFHALR